MGGVRVVESALFPAHRRFSHALAPSHRGFIPEKRPGDCKAGSSRGARIASRKGCNHMNELGGRFSEWAYAAMRFVVAALYACHGAQKVFGVLGGQVMPRGSLLFFAGVIEIVAGPLIAVGLLTRIAAFVASGEMAAAYFKSHAPKGFWPIENKGEFAVACCFVFLFVFAFGPGRISLDSAFRRKVR